MEEIRCKFVAAEVEDSRCGFRYDGAAAGMEDPRGKNSTLAGRLRGILPHCGVTSRDLLPPIRIQKYFR